MSSALQQLIDAMRGRPSPGTQWHDVLELARTHRAISLLYQEARDSIPSPYKEELAHAFHANVAHDVFIVRELISLCSMLTHAGIRVLPYKGPLLAQYAYGDTTMREYDDLDFVIPTEHLLQARTLILDHGYRDTRNLTDRQRHKLLRSGEEWLFRHPETKLRLDIKPLAISHLMAGAEETEGLFLRAETVDIGGSALMSLSPGDTFLCACVHGTLNRWYPLRQIADIAGLMRHADINWPEILSISAAKGTRRILLHSISLASEVFGAQIPHGLEELIRKDRTAQQLTDEVTSDIESGQLRCPPAKRAYYKLRSFRGVKRKARFLCRLTTRHAWQLRRRRRTTVP